MLNSKKEYINKHYHLLVFLLSACLIILFILALFYGSVPLSINDFLSGLTSYNDSLPSTIIHLRLPRVLLAALIGALLAVSGVIMQALFRNPLADPSLIGVTAGASLGASLVIFFVSSVFSGGLFTSAYTSNSFLLNTFINEFFFVAIGAFAGGLMAVFFVYTISKSRITSLSVSTMLLAGIAIGALAASGTSLLEFYSTSETLKRLSLWRMGSLDGANYYSIIIFSIFLTITLIFRKQYADILNAFLLGESQARHLGIDTERVKVRCIIFVTLITAISVAVCGVITFIGLVVPHIARLIVGANHKRLILISLLGGALLLVCADLLSRILLPPTQLPIGVITAIIGVPFFLSLLKTQTRRG